jgi:hypothetical protein
MDQFTLTQNTLCEKCVSGGQCINGILYNQAGIFLFKNIKFNEKNQGYWKANSVTKNIYPCAPFSDSCLALNNETYEAYSICERGYIGPLCQTCDQNFAKYGGKECRVCFTKWTNYVIIIIIAFACTILLSIYIRSLFFHNSIIFLHFH